jgi:hypothetical protein
LQQLDGGFGRRPFCLLRNLGAAGGQQHHQAATLLKGKASAVDKLRKEMEDTWFGGLLPGPFGGADDGGASATRTSSVIALDAV